MSKQPDIFYDPTNPFSPLREALIRTGNIRVYPTQVKTVHGPVLLPQSGFKMNTTTQYTETVSPTPAQEHYLADHLRNVSEEDYQELLHKEKTYKGSWKKRGGVGAFMMLARKWDRIESIAEAGLGHSADQRLSKETVSQYDILSILQYETSWGSAGMDGTLLAEIRDLRRYLLLVEAELEFRTSQQRSSPTLEPEATKEQVSEQTTKGACGQVPPGMMLPSVKASAEVEEINRALVGHGVKSIDRSWERYIPNTQIPGMRYTPLSSHPPTETVFPESSKEQEKQLPPIPANVIYSNNQGGFYHVLEKRKMGHAFVERWIHRSSEFPKHIPPEPIPEGVYYSKEHDNFYDSASKQGLGIVFKSIWGPRFREFPTEQELQSDVWFSSKSDTEIDMHR